VFAVASFKPRFAAHQSGLARGIGLVREASTDCVADYEKRGSGWRVIWCMSPSIRALCGTLAVLLAGRTSTAAVAAGSGDQQTAARGAGGAGVIVFGGVRWGTGSVSPGIYVLGADGGGLRRLTNAANAEDVDPAWRPDGRQIVFARRDVRGWRLYL
jgi:hypothetical protein